MRMSPLYRRVRDAGLVTALFLVASSAFAGTLDDALELRKSGKWEEALPLFEKAVAENATSADAALGLTETLIGLGRYADAAKAAKAGTKANPEHMGLLVAEARSHLLLADQGDTEGADANYILSEVAEADLAIKAALKVDAASADARVLKAKVYRYQGGGWTEESRDLLEAVVQDVPDHFDANWDLGQYHLKKGAATWKKNDAAAQEAATPHWIAAEKYLRACVASDPTSGNAHWELANALAWQGSPDTWKEYAAAAKLLPGNEGVLSKLYGWSHSDKEQRVQTFRELAELRPADGAVAIFLAWAQHENGDTAAGIATLRKAADAAPTSPYVPLNLGHLLIAKTDADGAMTAYEDAISKCDGFVKQVYDDVNMRATRSDVFDIARREKLWTALWVKWPEAADAPNNAALTYRGLREFEKSKTWYLRAAEAAPDSPQVQNDTALVLDQYLGRHDEAEPYYRRAIALGADQGRDWQAPGIENNGYRDALNNFGKMLAEGKRWKDLARFCEDDLPAGHPSREMWLAMARKGGHR